MSGSKWRIWGRRNPFPVTPKSDFVPSKSVIRFTEIRHSLALRPSFVRCKSDIDETALYIRWSKNQREKIWNLRFRFSICFCRSWVSRGCPSASDLEGLMQDIWKRMATIAKSGPLENSHILRVAVFAVCFLCFPHWCANRSLWGNFSEVVWPLLGLLVLSVCSPY